MQDILNRKKEYYIFDGTQYMVHAIFIVNATFLVFVPLGSV